MHDVFISFKGQPKSNTPEHLFDPNSYRIAAQLKKELEGDLGISTFHFNHDVAPGADFLKKITETLRGCKAVVILLSEAYIHEDSEYCNHELNTARKIKKESELSIFSADATFRPDRHPVQLSGVNAADISDWVEGFSNLAVLSAIKNIARSIDRTELIELVDVLKAPDSRERNDEIMNWCLTHPKDQASAIWMSRLFRNELRSRQEENEAARDQFREHSKTLSTTVDEKLRAERDFLDSFKSKVDRREQLVREDWTDLKQKFRVDLSGVITSNDKESPEVKRLTTEIADAQKKLADATTDLNWLSAEHRKKEEELSRLRDENRRLNEDLARIRSPDTDELETLLMAIEPKASPAVNQRLRAAWKYRENARSNNQQAVDLVSEIEDLLSSKTGMTRKVSGPFVFHYTASTNRSIANFVGKLEVPEQRVSQLHKGIVYGFFNRLGEFIGPGAIFYKANGYTAGEFYGEIDGLDPKSGGYGIYSFRSVSRTSAKEFSGSVMGDAGLGCLVRADGSVYWGDTLQSGFGDFFAHGFGVNQRSAGTRDPEAVVSGRWENNVLIAS
jgi:hypothetical protein